MKTCAVILAGGTGARLSVLTAKRTKPAVPFAGKYRIIDFALSNCVNSGIFDVMVLAQYRPHSLIEHLGAGNPWDLNRDFTGGLRIYSPYKSRQGSDWFDGTADAVLQNLAFIRQNSPELVLVLSGDHLYAMDYAAMIEFHKSRQADVTIGAVKVSRKEASRFGVLELANDGRVLSFIEKPDDPSSEWVNMGVYLFEPHVLEQTLAVDQQQTASTHDFGLDVLPRLVAEGLRVYAFPYYKYWMDVGTVASYWQSHMDLLGERPQMNLDDPAWVIHTRSAERPPARVARGAQVADSMVSDGCRIESGALVECSILSPGVVVRSGAVVRQSIIMQDSLIGAGAQIGCAILDKRVVVGEKVQIGEAGQGAEVKLTLVGKNSILPPDLVLEPGVVLGADMSPKHFKTNFIRAGEPVQNKESDEI